MVGGGGHARAAAGCGGIFGHVFFLFLFFWGRDAVGMVREDCGE